MLKTPPIRRYRRMSAAALAAFTAIAMTACGSEQSDSGPSSSSDSTGSSSATVADATAVIDQYSAPITEFPDVAAVKNAGDLNGKSVWYVPVSTAPPAFQVYAEALTEALATVGAEVHVCDGKFVPTAIAACLEQAGSSGADAVVTEAVDYTLAGNAIDDLAAKGVKVVMGGQALPEGKHNTDSLAFRDTTGQIDLGQELTASALIADSGGKANILYIGTSEVNSLKEAGDHAIQYLDDKCPDCKVTRIEYTSAGLDKVPSAISAALIKAPDTNYIFAELDTVVPLAVAGARSAGFGDKVRIGGMGGDLAVVQGIAKGGPELATSGSLLAYNSWALADDVVRMLSGEAPSDESLPTPSRLFTKENTTDLTLTPEGYASMDWYGDDTYKAKFTTAWGVK